MVGGVWVCSDGRWVWFHPSSPPPGEQCVCDIRQSPDRVSYKDVELC